MSNKKKIMCLLLISVLTISLFGCNNGAQVNNQKNNNEDNNQYEVTINNFNKDTIYKKVPEKIVTLSIGELEICLELGLEDKIVGIVIAEGYAKDYDEKIQKLPVLAEGYGTSCVPTLETIIEVEPDFVYGTAFAFNANYGIASQKDFDELNINTYVTKGTYETEVTIDDVYEDIENIGKIFNKEEKATTVIEKMKNEITKYKKEYDQPKTVFVYDNGTEKPSTAGKCALITSLIETVGGKNIFDDIDKQFTQVNWEAIAEANPSYIVINDYEGTTAEQKIEVLKNHAALKEVDAVKNNNFIIVPLDYSFPGMKNIDAIKILSEAINKEK